MHSPSATRSFYYPQVWFLDVGLLFEQFDIGFDELCNDVPSFGVIGDQAFDLREAVSRDVDGACFLLAVLVSQAIRSRWRFVLTDTSGSVACGADAGDRSAGEIRVLLELLQ